MHPTSCMSSTFTEKTPDVNEIGWFGLLVPFLIVFLAVMLFGNRSVGQVAETSWLILLPIAILFLRRRAHRTLIGARE